MRLWPGFKLLKFSLKLSMPRSIRRDAEQLPQSVFMRHSKTVGGRNGYVGNNSSAFPIRAANESFSSRVRQRLQACRIVKPTRPSQLCRAYIFHLPTYPYSMSDDSLLPRPRPKNSARG